VDDRGWRPNRVDNAGNDTTGNIYSAFNATGALAQAGIR
jgi:hypothetical protein